jgi:rubrerythrin
MFTSHDVLDIAIQLENNGEKTYRDAVRHASTGKLKDLLVWMANEEKNHARWFSNLKNRLIKGEDHHLVAEMSRALVEDVIQGQAFSLEEIDFSTLDTPKKMISTFIGFEGDTIAFYEFLKNFVEDPMVVRQLEQIITEENNHIAQLQDLLKNTGKEE